MSAFQRHFVNEVKKCNEMQRILRFFEDQINKEKRELLIQHHQDPENLDLIKIEEEIYIYDTNINLDELRV